ncbi:uncharacterized protein BT62DRAFT_581245 [Guyanagaster necrorhizus]|uniref:Protein kinase domain-containing protein n=1 Tax=Guyanagaster necrorhizus TaxID=856835 RepID=A0A9P7VHN4_9AGAR|nr:uncharacterized protein BT62DRAFT_581245 [Guyanagaster necrorhizus MCA 3950]KAG7440550.1 hypothetical protein BT62DRAFT_581245 [Guyanagaster necrorhizus MCA 3950]
MLNAVKDAIIAHEKAVIKVQIMHRDISVGNILITEDCNGHIGGILIDWDLSKSIKDLNKGPRSIERTGTWQFIFVHLLLDRTAVHSVSDDLESFVHVLTWVILRFTPSALTADKLASLLKQLYEEAEDILDDSAVSGGYTVRGGQTKRTTLATALMVLQQMKLLNKNLDRLLTTLLRGFGVRYGSELHVNVMVLEKNPPATQALLGRIQSHKWILEAVTAALNDRSAWPANDRSRHNPVLKVEATALNRMKRKSERERHNDFIRLTQKVRIINEERQALIRMKQVPPGKRKQLKKNETC